MNCEHWHPRTVRYRATEGRCAVLKQITFWASTCGKFATLYVHMAASDKE